MLKEGDWVEAKTLAAHAVIGYIERMVCEKRQVLVRVIRGCCDRAQELEWVKLKDCKRIEDTNISDTEGYLLNAIDLALDTGDTEEFFRRTSELRRLRGLRVNPDKIYATVSVTL